MPLTAGQIIALALESAHSPGKTAQALNLLNSILSDLCQERDFAEARGQFLFNFTPTGRPGGGATPGQPPQPGQPPPTTTPPQPQVALWGTAIWGTDQWSPSAATAATLWGTSVWGEAIWGFAGSQIPEPVPPPVESVPPPVESVLPPSEPIAPMPAVWPGVQFGSGPYVMPLDYLRLSGSSGSHGAQRSFIWWLDGVPYPVIPVDLAEFDMQVQQTGLQSYVWLSATDMSAPIDDRILLETTADVVAGSTELNNLASTVRLIGGNVLGVAGQGIAPGTMLSELPDDLVAGLGSGPQPVVPPGAQGALASGSSAQLVTSAPATLSRPAVATITGASIFFGYPPVIFVYPPPIDVREAMIRYQKQMPPVVDTTRFPWMHNDRYLLKALTGRLCGLNDDARAEILNGGPDIAGSAESELTNYLSMKDDEQSHPKRVELDRRVFGRQISNLGITKRVGW